MAEHDGDRQLDLLSAACAPPSDAREEEALAVRWAKIDALGRVGRAAWPGRGGGMQADLEHLRDHHRATVLLAVSEDPAALIDAATEVEIDVRHLAPGEHGERLAQHAGGLAADLRSGRRVVVVGQDPSAVALPLACALALLGKSEAETLESVEGALEPAEREAVRAFFAAHAVMPRVEQPTASAENAGGSAVAAESLEAPERPAPNDEGEPSSTGAEADEPEAAMVDGKARLDLDGMFEGEVAAAHDLEALARSPRAARRLGAVLGAAIGDAMGHPTEFIDSFDAIRERFGAAGVTGYELYRERDGARVAPYTDDTQMAECVLRSLLWGRAQGADLDATMRDLAARFVAWSNDPEGGHRAPGNACLAGCRNLERGVDWSEAGGETAGGCGSVMRAYPVGLLFAHDLGRAEAWAVAQSKLTHRDPIALAASAAMAVGIARVSRDDPLAVVLSEMVAAACRYSPKTAAMMAEALEDAQAGVGPEETLDRLRGWAAHEAIAAAVYIVARHPDDPRAAILEGANTPGDSDSIATLAGALVGARAGVLALPSDWVRDLERSDDFIALALAI